MADAERLGADGNLIHTGRGVRIARPRAARRGGRGRTTTDTSSPFLGNLMTIIAPEDFEQNWRAIELHRDAFSRYTPAQLLDISLNISPLLSRGLWDYLRLLNPAVSVDAFIPGTEQTDGRAQDALDEFRDRLALNNGAEKVVYTRLFFAACYGGAFFSELVMDQSGNVPIDIAVPDPFSVRFRKRQDPDRGEVWQIGQWQHAEFVPLDDTPRIIYIPVDPKPGKPYGRPMLMPALFPTLFLMGLYHDLRRVVAQQGYSRYDISVSLERLAAAFPKAYNAGGDTWENAIDRTLGMVDETFSSLEADDTFVHTDDSTVNPPKGALDGRMIAAAVQLIDSLKLDGVQGLKTMPLMMGITDQVSEANSNRQWEMLTESIDTLQDFGEEALQRHYTDALQAQGIVADVRVEFEKVRQSEEFRIEQARQLRITNATSLLDLGMMTWAEAAREALGREPSDEALTEHKKAEKEAEELAAQLPTTPPAADDPAAQEDQSGEEGEEAPTEKAREAELIRKAVALASLPVRREGLRRRRR